MRAIEAVVELNIIQLLGTPSGDESMLRLVRDMLMCALANPTVMKDKLSKASVAKGLALIAIRHNLLQDTITTVIDALHKLEHPSAAQAIAQASAYASIELGDGQLMAELVSELASGEYPKDTEAQVSDPLTNEAPAVGAVKLFLTLAFHPLNVREQKMWRYFLSSWLNWLLERWQKMWL